MNKINYIKYYHKDKLISEIPFSEDKKEDKNFSEIKLFTRNDENIEILVKLVNKFITEKMEVENIQLKPYKGQTLYSLFYDNEPAKIMPHFIMKYNLSKKNIEKKEIKELEYFAELCTFKWNVIYDLLLTAEHNNIEKLVIGILRLLSWWHVNTEFKKTLSDDEVLFDKKINPYFSY